MSTNDVPGAKVANRDELAMGCWAEHEDGSLIFVEGVEASKVVYSVFDVAQDPPIEYRDAMSDTEFKRQYSFDPKATSIKNLKWTWHDKTPFPWDRIMSDFPAGERASSAIATLTAAQKVAESLKLRAGEVDKEAIRRRSTAGGEVSFQPARTIMERLGDALAALKK